MSKEVGHWLLKCSGLLFCGSDEPFQAKILLCIVIQLFKTKTEEGSFAQAFNNVFLEALDGVLKRYYF